MKKYGNFKTKKRNSLLSLIAASALMISNFPFATTALKADSSYIGDEALAQNNTPLPTADNVIPDANQYRYQKEELSAFMHFGPNTFNEIEWGERYGDRAPNDIFGLREDFDAETLVKALKQAGFKSLIVTAKHHDGFCIWNSKYTDYDVASTDYKGGNGDILAEVSAACSKYDLNMGLYLSPWDIHEPSYGYYDENHRPTSKENDHLDYNDYYNNQLEEILGNPIYGNKGRFTEVWMDGAKGNGANAQDYDFIRWFNTIQKHEGKAAGHDADCMLFGAEAYTTVRWIGNEHGLAAKDTWSKSKVDYTANTINSNRQGSYTVGFEDGNKWTVPEADARITSGWFWGTKKNTPKSIEDLANMYFGSVGHNATLLLNIPPNNKGKIDEAILNRLVEFGSNIQTSFASNLATHAGAEITASSVRGNDIRFKPSNTVDGDDATFWSTTDGEKSGSLLINLGAVKTFDIISVEEAIQFGQRINSYKLEYRDTKGNWQTVDSGVTIGAKRLARFAPVKGDQVRITVSTPDGKVPLISEVGVYKASAGFELANALPDGMLNIDISDASAWKFGRGWNDENGSKFVGGTNKWANQGASFDLTFTGSKVYLIGTKDPNHGLVDIFIDGEKVTTIDTSASSRQLGQIIYESPDLPQGQHTIRAEVKSKALGIEAAYVINNNEKGMVGLERNAYTMNEDESIDIKLLRVGGTKEAVTVTVSPNPGSAIQDDFDTEAITEVVFAPGETVKTARVTTKRNINKTGDRDFSVEVGTKDNDLLLGFNTKAIITIKDAETASLAELQALVDKFEQSAKEWYLSGYEAYAQASQEGKAVLEAPEASGTDINSAVTRIKEAVKNLTLRERYSEEDPFIFPAALEAKALLEAEFGTLKDVQLASDGKWSLRISKADWASCGKFVNCINQEDTVSYPYTATHKGIYSVKATYRSGSNSNKLVWSETANKIRAGEVAAGADDASITKHVTFDMEVLERGAGTLVFTGPDGKSPQLDKLEITLKSISEDSGATTTAATTTAATTTGATNESTTAATTTTETTVAAATSTLAPTTSEPTTSTSAPTVATTASSTTVEVTTTTAASTTQPTSAATTATSVTSASTTTEATTTAATNESTPTATTNVSTSTSTSTATATATTSVSNSPITSATTAKSVPTTKATIASAPAIITKPEGGTSTTVAPTSKTASFKFNPVNARDTLNADNSTATTKTNISPVSRTGQSAEGATALLLLSLAALLFAGLKQKRCLIKQ